MKKIDVIILGDFPPITYTGISIINSLVKKYLDDFGCKVIAIEESAWQLSNTKKVVHYITRYISLYKCLLINKVRILYINLPLTKLGLLRLLLVLVVSKLVSPRVRIIGHIHRGDIGSFLSISILNKTILKWCLGFFSEIILLSTSFLEDFNVLNFKGKISILPNTSIIENNGYSHNKNHGKGFICVSNFIRSKGIGELVEAFSKDQLRQNQLVLLGNIYDKDFYNELLGKATSNIIFKPNPTREVMQKALIEADCFILPSWNEGQPLVLLEAMSIGLPIISTNVGDIPTMVGGKYQYLINPRNVQELIIAVLQFADSTSKIDIGEALRNRYFEYYSNEQFRTRLRSIFC